MFAQLPLIRSVVGSEGGGGGGGTCSSTEQGLLVFRRAKSMHCKHFHNAAIGVWDEGGGGGGAASLQFLQM